MLSLKNQIDYQPGSVVSRELLKTNNGNVTLFAFDEGQGLSEHTSPFNVLVFIIEGKAVIKIGGAEKSLSEGQMIEFPAGNPHSVKAEKQFKMLLIMMK